MELQNVILDSVMQLCTFTAIPLLWWFFTARKKENFFYWLGLRPIKLPTNGWKIILFCTAGFFLYCFLSQYFLMPYILGPSVTLADDRFSGAGLAGLIPAIFYAMIQTGLTEEIFFRGFLGKRFSTQFGSKAGNIMQGTLFGLLHGVLFFAVTSPLKALIIIILTGTAGWLMGYADEEGAGGSLIPSWLMHGGGNLALAVLKLFNII